jgi:hypothetical protein
LAPDDEPRALEYLKGAAIAVSARATIEDV